MRHRMLLFVFAQSSGRVVDEEAHRLAAEREKQRADLYWSLRTRPLSEEEMKEVRRRGYHLCIGQLGAFISGGVRNALCDLNIHLMGAVSAAEQAKRMEREWRKTFRQCLVAR